MDDKKLEEIAKKYLRVNTLEARGHDDLDFHDRAVWDLKEALHAAYRAGVEDGFLSGKKKEE